PDFHLADQIGEFDHADRPFIARPHQSVEHLGAVELLPAAVLLDHHVRHLVDALIGGEALFAGGALPAAADGIAFAALPRIDDAVLDITAKRASHGEPSLHARLRIPITSSN